MDPEFWTERWALGEIGFHRSKPHWSLTSHWSVLQADVTAPVFVPLCGKSLDLHWLRSYADRVVGVELDPSAVTAFFAEWPESGPPKVENSKRHDGLVCHAANGIEIYQGDFFAFQPEALFGYFYDRAALIAMPPAMRSAYLRHLMALLSPGAQGILVTFEYQQNQMNGPPFSVQNEELNAFEGLVFECLEARDVIVDHPGMQSKGLTELVECVYRVSKP